MLSAVTWTLDPNEEDYHSEVCGFPQGAAVLEKRGGLLPGLRARFQVIAGT
jgi:hypothetical protein